MIQFFDLLKDNVADAAIDTLYIIPFLLITYLVLEFIEHRMSEKSQEIIKKTGVAGPAVGALLGIIPQCGFSAAASSFYAGRVITLGTLMAVYLSTSDEMIPIFIAGGIPIEMMLSIILFKLVIGMIMGFIIDALIRFIRTRKNLPFANNFEIHQMCERDKCSCNHIHKKNIIVPALLHTLQITLFIFLITVILNVIISCCGGQEAIIDFVNVNKYASVIASALIGLIPNCASSVIISQLYVSGILGMGALISGLLSAAGVGLLVLFRTNRPLWQSLVIVLMLFTISLLIGLLICILVS